MELICEFSDFRYYLLATKEVDYCNPHIEDKAKELFVHTETDMEKVKRAFTYVRDEIPHSWDIQGAKVTTHASDVLISKEGICYAKSMLLAALLRSQGIPTGFCYQRLLLFNSPDKGYCIHALNAVFLSSLQRWIRLDARGNKKGVDAQFCVGQEKLAFPINEKIGEKDYPTIYAHPHPKTIKVLNEHDNPTEMCTYHLPTYL